MGLKARVIATGEIVEINESSTIYDVGMRHIYNASELENVPDTDPDYWTRLEHQFAGMAMQGILGSEEIMKRINTMPIKEDQFGLVIAELSVNIAHALVDKYKKEER